ncbi:MAG: rhomboid family intramembrane serine protease [Gemmatimonadetes bacterium]|nr:rhomboid family intramembrane serine protease [Gemmatimonadota bacterium]
MFPLRDENPTELIPFITVAIILANVAVWLTVENAGLGRPFLDALCNYGSIPGELTGALSPGQALPLGSYDCVAGGATWSTVLTSMFLHGSWGHLIGNMWFLWVFGNNVEDSMGHSRFVVFYLLTGVVAAAAHVMTAPASGIPTVGASGAISGVMGAYMVLYPRVRVLTLVFFYLVYLPAWLMLGYWFLIQFLSGTVADGGAGVAFWAHVGGFFTGVLLVKAFERKRLVEAKLAGRKLTPEELRGFRW